MVLSVTYYVELQNTIHSCYIFCFSPTKGRKTRWTMSVDNVGLRNMSLGDLKLHGHADTFSRALGRLHGPLRKPPLKEDLIRQCPLIFSKVPQNSKHNKCGIFHLHVVGICTIFNTPKPCMESP
jgi:hypothetical protein